MMNRTFVSAIAALVFAGFAQPSDAADAKAQLDELVQKVKAKLQTGKNKEQDFAEELKAFDTLQAEHQGEKTEDVAQIPFMKGLLYTQVFGNDEKAVEILNQVKTDFPETGLAKKAEQVVASIASQAAAKKTQATLVEGVQFPDFEEKDLEGNPLSLSKFKGKVILVDFWATWCGPCIAELPNVLKAYEKYHDKGFEIVGISLDSEKEKLTAFIKKNKMPWPQYFDGKGWQSKLGEKYGITAIPATFLLDKDGKLLAKDLRGDALDKAVEQALK
jgi:thiol-disulfide isomerase/thioredoxin